MRVNIVQKARKSPGNCEKCATVLAVGAPYRWWQAYRGTRHTVCMKPSCTPTAADLTGSEKVARLYEAREAARLAVGDCDDTSSIGAERSR